VRKKSAEIRAKLSHPVVDSDGHAIECGPVFLDYLKQVGGADVAHRYEQRLSTNNWYTMTLEERQRKRVLRPASWTLPARNTYDRATAMLPSLLCSRMDDFGIDFSVVFSTLALSLMRERDDELRRAACRALNEMFADIFRSHGSRTAPVASIPAHTPEEAIEELRGMRITSTSCSSFSAMVTPLRTSFGNIRSWKWKMSTRQPSMVRGWPVRKRPCLDEADRGYSREWRP
jgi:hypothetical protein